MTQGDEGSRPSPPPEPKITDLSLRRPADPPDCPPGWTTAPPDFVGVGFQRCGTTRWFDLIVTHPRMVAPVSTRKELHYFDRFLEDPFTPDARDRYAHYFPRPPGQLTGEWTPSYATDFWTAPLLAAAAPGAHVLVLVRDPVERFASGMQRHYRVAAASGSALSYMAPHEAFQHGLYASQLERLFASIDRARVLVLQYERCVLEPRRELKRTFEFLGLEDAELAPDLEHHPNRQQAKPPLPETTSASLADAYRDDVARLFQLCPELELDLWPTFAAA